MQSKSYNDIRDANYSLIGNIFDDISEHELIIYLNTEPSNEEAEEMNTLFKRGIWRRIFIKSKDK